MVDLAGRDGTGQIFCNRSGPAGLKICPVRSGRYPARSFSKPNRRKSGENNGTQTQLVDFKWWRDQIFDIFMSESEVKNPNLGKNYLHHIKTQDIDCSSWISREMTDQIESVYSSLFVSRKKAISVITVTKDKHVFFLHWGNYSNRSS